VGGATELVSLEVIDDASQPALAGAAVANMTALPGGLDFVLGPYSAAQSAPVVAITEAATLARSRTAVLVSGAASA
jgi:ABC-type branched-subunit amino acid transport system substrate-binding protein